MKRTWKLISLACIVAFALSAVVGNTVWAHEFTSSETPAIWTGEEHVNKVKISIGSAVTECSNYEAVARVTASPSDTVTISPKFSGCTFEPFGAATITVNHCAFIYDSDTNANGEAPMDIECVGSDKIEVAAAGCTVKIGAQTGLNGTKYTNVKTGTRKEITTHPSIFGIAYEKSGISCFLISGEGRFECTETYKLYRSNKAPSGTELTTPASYGHTGEPIDGAVE